MLDQTPAPRGRELLAATGLAAFCSTRWPEIEWTVQPYGTEGANVVARCGEGPLLYSHVDTSLDGDGLTPPEVTGREDAPARLKVSDTHVEGFCLGVARAPVAAAVAAFANAQRGTLLISGSGTHRRGGHGEGVGAFLADQAHRGSSVPSAIVAKGGPPALITAEPGAAFLKVRITGRNGVAMMPDSAFPSGGVIAHAGLVLEAIETWRSRYVSSRGPFGRVGAQAGVGAIRAGWTQKPDLLPAELLLDLYVLTVPGEQGSRLATELTATLHAKLAGGPLEGCSAHVEVEWLHGSEGTDESAPIVEAARHAWGHVFDRAPLEVSGWTGSTDGIVLRAHGIDTVRVGPQSERSKSDPRLDIVDLAVLSRYQRLYEMLLNDEHEH